MAGRAACPSATGMNLSSGLEDVPGLFWPTVQASLGAGAGLAVVMYSYYKVRKVWNWLIAMPRRVAPPAALVPGCRRAAAPAPCPAMPCRWGPSGATARAGARLTPFGA